MPVVSRRGRPGDQLQAARALATRCYLAPPSELVQVVPTSRKRRVTNGAGRNRRFLRRLRQLDRLPARDRASGTTGVLLRSISAGMGPAEPTSPHLASPWVCADQLLGLATTKRNGRARDTRLWRRFEKIEKLPPAERKPIIQMLDAFLAKGRAD